MKTKNFLHVFFLSFLSLTYTSCSNDDSNDPDSGSIVDISGSWELQSFVSVTITQQNVSNPTLSITAIRQSAMPDVQIFFATNPNQVTSSGTMDIIETTIVSGSIQDERTSTLENIDASDLLAGEWTQNENQTLTIQFPEAIDLSDNPTFQFQFTRITDNLLEIESSSSFTTLFEGTDFRIETTYNFVLVRV
ncbi:hypothetical protein ACJD0Z_13350 [Flavobacteriaceae bacterium M23B6Z8]